MTMRLASEEQKVIIKPLEVNRYPGDIIYTEEQMAAMHIGIKETLAMDQGERGYVTCEWCNFIVRRGEDGFAVFDSVAYKILPPRVVEEESFGRVTRTEYVPAVFEGRTVGVFPQRGKGGLLTLKRKTIDMGKKVKNPRWETAYTDGGWLMTVELGPLWEYDNMHDNPVKNTVKHDVWYRVCGIRDINSAGDDPFAYEPFYDPKYYPEQPIQLHDYVSSFLLQEYKAFILGQDNLPDDVKDIRGLIKDEPDVVIAVESLDGESMWYEGLNVINK